jgi:hypothetical protein
MKYCLITMAFFFIILSPGCSKDENQDLEAYNAEAFAFDIGGMWEVNASTRVKGFRQTEENKNFYISLVYEVDVVTPGGDTLKSLITRVEDKTSSEKLMDIPLEVQFELDSTYIRGNYVLVFRINEPETGNTADAAAVFEL